MRRFFRKKEEGGAAMVEFAVIFALLLTIALGAFEYGMLFRDWLSVTVSAREGARVGASAGTVPNADCIILEASAGALQSLTSGAVDHVAIYRSSPPGNWPGPTSSRTKRYRPAGGDTPDLTCSGGSEWIRVNNGGAWDPEDRNNEGPNADWIGVRVEFTHNWLTDFLWFSGSASFSDDAVFRLEPPAPS